MDMGNISMGDISAIGRRAFVATASATAAGFSLGWSFPAEAQSGGGSELGVWVVVHPDNATTIRIARSEMGQGTLTGLAQLVAEELDADWSRVRAEYVAPEENLAKSRAWG